jgi:hypothetical protein
MAKRTGLFVLGLALIAATTSAEVVEEERFDRISSFEWVSVYRYENPPLLIVAFEGDVDEILPSALPGEAMFDDTPTFLPFTEKKDPFAREQQQLQAP